MTVTNRIQRRVSIFARMAKPTPIREPITVAAASTSAGYQRIFPAKRNTTSGTIPETPEMAILRAFARTRS